jgi:LacI family transcriptional regulator
MPVDISLIGFDDVSLAAWEVFQLTTVSQDIHGLVNAATELLLTRIAAAPGEEPPPRRVVLAPTLVRRQTHGPPAARA